MLRFEELPVVNSKEWLDLKDLEGEEWREVNDYKGLYQVSNYGRVKSLGRVMRYNYYKYQRPRILRANILSDCCPYYVVHLTDRKGYEKNFRVHRLVAMAFIDNKDNLPFVNHKDENTINNCVYNLEWCTEKYNSNYGRRNSKLSNSKKKAVVGYCVETGEVVKYDSALDASKTGLFNRQNICDCLKGRLKTHKGYKWKLVD